nr:hypothetical protein [Bacteroides fragilis]
MSYSQFIMAVFAIYVVYYAANILYDAFLKQSKTNTGEEEEIISIGEEEEIPHKVVDEDFETGSYEKEDEKKESEQNYVSVNESIEMEVETQGIPMESSCTKHEDIIDTSLQPGSILCSDGSIVHPSLFSPNEKEAIGVVFWCNDGNNPDIKETAYAVSLEDLEENPLIDTDEDIANVSEDENSFDGAANTAAIMNFAIKDSLAYPAAQKAIEYAPKGVTGWFIGSIAQNKAISNNLEKVYSSFSIIGGTHFDGWYWSSTEDGAGKDTPKVFALISSLTKGRATSTSKRNSFKIRPIIAIR